MNSSKVCFAIISPCHAIITDSEEWHKRKQLDDRTVDNNLLPPQFKKLVKCGYEFNCSAEEARKRLAKLGFRESKTLGESRILDQEMLFDNED